VVLQVCGGVPRWKLATGTQSKGKCRYKWFFRFVEVFHDGSWPQVLKAKVSVDISGAVFIALFVLLLFVYVILVCYSSVVFFCGILMWYSSVVFFCVIHLWYSSVLFFCLINQHTMINAVIIRMIALNQQ